MNLCHQVFGLLSQGFRVFRGSRDHSHPIRLEADPGDQPPGPFHSLSRPPISFKVFTGALGAHGHIGGIRKFLECPQQVDRIQSSAARDREEANGFAILLLQGLSLRLPALRNILTVEKSKGSSSIIVHIRLKSFQGRMVHGTQLMRKVWIHLVGVSHRRHQMHPRRFMRHLPVEQGLAIP